MFAEWRHLTPRGAEGRLSSELFKGVTDGAEARFQNSRAMAVIVLVEWLRILCCSIPNILRLERTVCPTLLLRVHR
jgi:hypothetical protein